MNLIEELHKAQEKVREMSKKLPLKKEQCSNLQQTLTDIIEIYEESPIFPDAEGELIETQLEVTRRMLNNLWRDGDCFRFSNLNQN